MKLGEWNHVVMTYDGSGKADGLAVFANGKRLDVDVLRNALTGPIATVAPLTLGRSALGPPYLGQVDDLRLYSRALTPAEVEDLAIHYRSRAILSGVNGKRSKDQARRTCASTSSPTPRPRRLAPLYSELEALAAAEGGGGEADSDRDGDGAS